ncbi:MAG TPA: hypothetical protein VIJ78_12740 [Pseudolabrys sp.]|nr:hypothetical protein [Pseudolabrys sp.]
MKSFLVACVAAIIIAAVGGFVLEGVQQTVKSAYNETGAKL